MDTEIVKVKGGAAVPPAHLHAQLLWKRLDKRLPADEIAKMAVVSYQAISDVLHGKGSFVVFCKVVDVLGLKIDFRSWDYQRILCLEDPTDPQRICAALTNHSSQLPYFAWGRVPERDETAIYWCEPTLKLRSVTKYLRYIGVSARLVGA